MIARANAGCGLTMYSSAFLTFIRRVFGAIATLALSAAFSVTHATPVHYVIAFTPGTGVVPTGSFDYDGSAVANPFSNFVVTWNAGAINFTAEANAFHFRTDIPGVGFDEFCSANAVSDAFELLTDASCMAGHYATSGVIREWQAVNKFSSNDFIFLGLFRESSG